MKKKAAVIHRKTMKPIRHTVRDEFYRAVSEVLRTARSNAYRTVNFMMVEAYWNVGRMIVEEEQQGQKRADYGSFLIMNLSSKLTDEFGVGFDPSNLKRMRQFYITFPNLRTLLGESASYSHGSAESAISATLWHLLTWSHFKLLLRLKSQKHVTTTPMKPLNRIGLSELSNVRLTHFTMNVCR